MAEYYGASFTIESSHQKIIDRGLELMDEVSGMVRRWAGARFGELIGEEQTGEWRDSNGTLLQISQYSFRENGIFDLRLEHLDINVATSRWRTDFRLATCGTSVDVNVEVRLIHDKTPQSEYEGNASRPRILEAFFEKFECRFGQESLTKQAIQVTPEGASAFVDSVIFDPNRVMPAVVVTKNSFGGRFVNPDRLQSRLLGLARVFTYDDETVQVVNEKLDSLKCFGGAVRVYRPGCSKDDVSWQNRYWKGMHIWEIGWEDLVQNVIDECMSCSPFQVDLSTYNEVKDLIHQNSLQELEAGAELQDYYAQLETENVRLRREIRELDDELRSLRNKNVQLTLALQHQGPDTQGYDDISDDPQQEPSSVEEAVRRAKLSLGGLRFFNSALESASKSPFRRPNDVHQAFEALDDCASSLEQGQLGKSIKAWLRENHNIEFTPVESSTTMGQYGGERRFWDRAKHKTVEMQSHIKLGGGGNDPQRQMRIHVLWEESESKWLVGHVGEHLSTATG